MYRRYSSRSRFSRFRRFGGGFRRSGARLRRPAEPARWEVCNIAGSTQTVVSVANPTFTSVMSLAQIAGHLGDAGTIPGRQFQNMVRWLEIGGIVFFYRYGESFTGDGEFYKATNLENTVNELDHRVLLCSDRLDASAAPCSIPNWFTSNVPFTSATISSTQGDDYDFPTRIHWQNHHGQAHSSMVDDVASSFGPYDVRTLQPRGRANLRLRLRLDDTTGLFFHCASRLVGASVADASVATDFRFFGTMYYRVRF